MILVIKTTHCPTYGPQTTPLCTANNIREAEAVIKFMSSRIKPTDHPHGPAPEYTWIFIKSSADFMSAYENNDDAIKEHCGTI